MGHISYRDIRSEDDARRNRIPIPGPGMFPIASKGHGSIAAISAARFGQMCFGQMRFGQPRPCPADGRTVDRQRHGTARYGTPCDEIPTHGKRRALFSRGRSAINERLCQKSNFDTASCRCLSHGYYRLSPPATNRSCRRGCFRAVRRASRASSPPTRSSSEVRT